MPTDRYGKLPAMSTGTGTNAAAAMPGREVKAEAAGEKRGKKKRTDAQGTMAKPGNLLQSTLPLSQQSTEALEAELAKRKEAELAKRKHAAQEPVLEAEEKKLGPLTIAQLQENDDAQIKKALAGIQSDLKTLAEAMMTHANEARQSINKTLIKEGFSTFDFSATDPKGYKTFGTRLEENSQKYKKSSDQGIYTSSPLGPVSSPLIGDEYTSEAVKSAGSILKTEAATFLSAFIDKFVNKMKDAKNLDQLTEEFIKGIAGYNAVLEGTTSELNVFSLSDPIYKKNHIPELKVSLADDQSISYACQLSDILRSREQDVTKETYSAFPQDVNYMLELMEKALDYRFLLDERVKHKDEINLGSKESKRKEREINPIITEVQPGRLNPQEIPAEAGFDSKAAQPDSSREYHLPTDDDLDPLPTFGQQAAAANKQQSTEGGDIGADFDAPPVKQKATSNSVEIQTDTDLVETKKAKDPQQVSADDRGYFLPTDDSLGIPPVFGQQVATRESKHSNAQLNTEGTDIGTDFDDMPTQTESAENTPIKPKATSSIAVQTEVDLDEAKKADKALGSRVQTRDMGTQTEEQRPEQKVEQKTETNKAPLPDSKTKSSTARMLEIKAPKQQPKIPSYALSTQSHDALRAARRAQNAKLQNKQYHHFYASAAIHTKNVKIQAASQGKDEAPKPTTNRLR